MKICFALILMSVVAYSQPIKVMTYNIRYDTEKDSVNKWSNRKDKVSALIQKYDPDLIGLQEALHHQVMDILKALPQYNYIGVGRDDGKEKGEYSAILYKKERFEMKRETTSWLSETPKVAGSKSWDAAITRILTRGEFVDKKTGKEIHYYNTHFDHIGQEARKKSVPIIKKAILQETGAIHDGPQKTFVIITGDFNSQPTEEPYLAMVAFDNYKDARPPESTQGTFCTFSVNGPPCRIIDHIFYGRGVKKLDYKVITDNDGIYYPSDHLPVIAEFIFD